MLVDLGTPILVESLRSVNFFNGRLVSAEDLTDEQKGHRVVHELLGSAIGDGIVGGLEVLNLGDDGTPDLPLLAVRAGAAINGRGEVLVLPADTIVRLAKPADVVPNVQASDVFFTCTPPQASAPLVDAAVYLLTICSSRAGEGKTPFGGLGDLPPRCNMRWIVESVEFRLIDLKVSEELQSIPDRLRNRIAYACFGTGARALFARDPFGDAQTPATLLDALRGTALTDCDVPLALLQWKSEGVQFIDLWSVRRHCASGSSAPGEIAFSGRAAPLADAMSKQFADQLDEILRVSGDPESVEARRFFRFLPPAAFLPVSSGATKRFDYLTFFSGKTCSQPWYIEGGDVEAILRESVHYPPVDLDEPQMVWIYFVRENRAPRSGGELPILSFADLAPVDVTARFALPAFPVFDDVPQYVLFANGNVPFFGHTRFHRSYFDFSNFD
jgi:hypothetical protein